MGHSFHFYYTSYLQFSIGWWEYLPGLHCLKFSGFEMLVSSWHKYPKYTSQRMLWIKWVGSKLEYLSSLDSGKHTLHLQETLILRSKWWEVTHMAGFWLARAGMVILYKKSCLWSCPMAEWSWYTGCPQLFFWQISSSIYKSGKIKVTFLSNVTFALFLQLPGF